MADSSFPADKHCSHCKKAGSEQAPLKRCTRCRSAWYCNRDCQKADWKTHKKTCTSNAQVKSDAGAAEFTSTQEDPGEWETDEEPEATKATKAPYDPTPYNPTPWNGWGPFPLSFMELGKDKWLHKRPEKAVFKLLIDTYRLRLDDDYKFAGKVESDTLYGGAPDNGVSAFRRFLKKAEERQDFLPDWWSPAKVEECVRFATPSSSQRQPWEWWGEVGMDDWSDLAVAVGKSDIMDHYKNPFLHMQMRIMGEQIYDIPLGGRGGRCVTN